MHICVLGASFISLILGSYWFYQQWFAEKDETTESECNVQRCPAVVLWPDLSVTMASVFSISYNIIASFPKENPLSCSNLYLFNILLTKWPVGARIFWRLHVASFPSETTNVYTQRFETSQTDVSSHYWLVLYLFPRVNVNNDLFYLKYTNMHFIQDINQNEYSPFVLKTLVNYNHRVCVSSHSDFFQVFTSLHSEKLGLIYIRPATGSILCSGYHLISFTAYKRKAVYSLGQKQAERTGGDERERKDWCFWICSFQAQLFSSGSMQRSDLTALWNGYKLDSLLPNHQSQTLNVFPFSPNICYQPETTLDK